MQCGEPTLPLIGAHGAGAERCGAQQKVGEQPGETEVGILAHLWDVREGEDGIQLKVVVTVERKDHFQGVQRREVGEGEPDAWHRKPEQGAKGDSCSAIENPSPTSKPLSKRN